ncbi:MAG: EamA family transporter, partial [Chitinophagaceae bacterium]
MGNRQLVTYFRLVFVSFFWGGTFIATRIATQTFQAFTGAAARYLVAILFLIPLAFFQKKDFFKISIRQFFIFLLIGFSGIFSYNYFFFQGLKSIPASRGALIVALNPS